MVKYLILLSGVLLFLSSFVAASSSTGVDLFIAGCSFDFDGVRVSVPPGYCSSEPYGLFYCDDAYTGYYTLKDMGGCSRGGTDFENICCPRGMFCNETTQICQTRIDNCYNLEDKESCEEVGCLWFDDSCIEGTADLGCEYYQTKGECEEDYWNLGKEGIGTEHCGDTIECGGEVLFIPSSGCECEWYDSGQEGKKCQMKLTASQFISADGIDSFSCSSSYNLGECIDGVQSIDWFSNVSGVVGFDTGIPEECLEALGCTNRAGERFCGEAGVKLSFFNIFGFLSSLMLIFVYFTIRR
jgi:hypothetical protein